MLAYLEPFIDTLGMEFVITGQYSQQLTRLEITHAHYTPVGKEGGHNVINFFQLHDFVHVFFF